MEKFKFTVPKPTAIYFKTKMKLSKLDYEALRTCLKDYLKIPCWKTIAAEIVPLLPETNPDNFVMDGRTVGKFYNPLAVIKDSVTDILNVFHGDAPGRVPNDLNIIGGFGKSMLNQML